MNSEIEGILSLQEVDVQLKDLQEDIPSYDPAIQDLKNKILIKKQDIKDYETKLKERILSKKALEGEVEAKHEQIKKYETQLNIVKTNAEYKTILNEIENVKKEIQKIEENIIELMEVEEVSDQELKDYSSTIDSQIKDIESEIKSLNDKQSEKKSDLEALEQKRQEVAQTLSGNLFKRYERIYTKRKRKVLVNIDEKGVCGGCSRILPPNERLRTMHGEIFPCENCSSLLYWDPTVLEDEAEKGQ